MVKSKKKIIFVDDEVKLLSGLKRLLRPMRDEWELDFALGGDEALAMMSEKKYDVIVSDMRMPGIDGGALLGIVKKKYPDTVRIILSGQSENEAILQSIGKTHVFLSKPCNPETLKSSIKRATSLREILNNEELTSVISKMDNIPSLPSLYQELIKTLESPHSSMKEISDIVAQDMGMTAKILQLVNSAYFGLAKEITNLTTAINYLGIDVLMSLVLNVKIFSLFDETKFPKMQVKRFWKHCMSTAIIAKLIMLKENASEKSQDDAFISGLLHDTGKTVLMVNYPEKYKEVRKKMLKENINISQVEKEVIGASHEEVGAYLLSLWGLPDVVIEGVAFHHAAENKAKEFECAKLIYIANQLERLVWEGKKREYFEDYCEQYSICFKVFNNPEMIWEEANNVVFVN